MPVRLLLLLVILPGLALAQGPRVPTRMEFAGIKLRIMESARKEIQKDVDALTKSPKYFNIKVERAREYFPIIERVFKEEGLHDDFKYLVLQESALISDAVSVSDAVGFWQFKDFTAMEVGLRVDKHVDERMNIVSSSRGAARYMKKNNQFFDNWLHTLQAYQMGAGGAMRVLGKGEKGAHSMVVDKKTYWYVKKYLAHKVAFEGAISGNATTQLKEYTKGANKSLEDIADEIGVGLAQLQDYNKWLKKGKIPDDRRYTVIVPVTKLQNVNLAALDNDNDEPNVSRKVNYDFPNAESFPKFDDIAEAKSGQVTDINGMPGMIAAAGDRYAAMAEKGGVDLSDFLKYNDIDISDKVEPGQVYYFKKKRNKAKTHYYAMQYGEDLWSVSQKFGIKLNKLKAKNRIKNGETSQVKPGRVLWLRYIRPARVGVEYSEVKNDPNVEEKVITTIKTKIAPDPARVTPPVDLQHPVGQVQQDGDRAEADPVEEEREVVVIHVEDDQEEAVDGNEYESVEEQVEEKVFEGGGGRQVHVVQPGETLYSISRQYGVTIKEMLDWNNMTISDGLSIDQKLVIYSNGAPPVKNEPKVQPLDKGEEIYHTVSQGDTLYSIARKYEVSLQDILRWNNKTDYNIHQGEKIKIIKR